MRCMIDRYRVVLRAAIVCTALVVAALSAVDALAQPRDAACLAMVREVYRDLSGFASSTSVCRISYTAHTVAQVQGRRVSSDVAVRVIANRDRMHMIGGDMEVYRDGRTTITVMPRNRRVYVADAGAVSSTQRLDMLASLRDTIFTMCESVQCADVEGGSKQVTLIMNAAARAAFRIGQVTLLVDMSRRTIRRLTIDYVEGSQVESVQITLQTMECGGAAREFDAPVASMVFDAEQKLLPKYSDYRLIDVRTRSSRH